MANKFCFRAMVAKIKKNLITLIGVMLFFSILMPYSNCTIRRFYDLNFEALTT